MQRWPLCAKKEAYLILSIPLLIFWDWAHAKDAPDEIDSFYAAASEETSLATGYALPTARAPAITTVITAQQIEKLGAVTVADVLRNTPGIYVTTARGINDVFVIRGFFDEYNSYVLLLLNGIPINNVVNSGRPQAWRMPVHNISRIEIMRGPGSALYGADAAAGVINIVTKTAQEIGGVDVGAYGGSFETGGGWLQAGSQLGDIEAAFSLEASSTNGYRKTIVADDQTNIDHLLGTHASLAPGPINTQRNDIDTRIDLKGHRWQFRAGYQGFINVGTGTGILMALDPDGDVDVGLTNADFTYDLAHDGQWDVTSQLSYLRSTTKASLTTFPPGTYGGYFPEGIIDNFHFKIDEIRGNVTALYGGIPQHRFRFGSGFSYSRVSDIEEVRNFRTVGGIPIPTTLANVREFGELPLLTEQSRTLWYGFAQDEWQFIPDWILTAGARLDSYSDFGTTLNPRIALVWNPSNQTTIKAIYGRAFRAPSFNELYGNSTVGQLNNRNLDPEIVNEIELSLDRAWNPKLQTKATIYGYDMDSQIRGGTEYDDDSDDPLTKIQQHNAKGRWGHGMELEATYRIKTNLVAQASYTYFKIQKATPDDPARVAPKHQIYTALDWIISDSWSLNTRMKWISDREWKFTGQAPINISSYAWTGATLRHSNPKGWDISLTVDNLFDVDGYEATLYPVSLPYGVPIPGRNVMLQLDWHLR